MASDKGRPLPEFGKWDVRNPASAEGFTVIFSKARDDRKKGTAKTGNVVPPHRNISPQKSKQDYHHRRSSHHHRHHHHHHLHLSLRKWLCCG